MMGKLLSVVVPIGPGDKRISSVGEWLSAALAEDIEVILVHDSFNREEKENFEDLIERNKHKNLKAISVNCGNPGQTRNEGLMYASGKWLAFWDSDDLPLISEFLTMVLQAENNGSELCIGGFRTRDVKTNDLNYFSIGLNPAGILQEIAAYPGIWRFAFQLDLVQDIKFESFSMGEDQAFLVRAVTNLDAINFHPEPVYEYRIGGANQITTMVSERRNILTSIKWLLNNKDKLSTYPLYEYFLVAQKITGLKTNLIYNLLEITAAAMKNINIGQIPIIFKIALSRGKHKRQDNMVTLYVAGGLGNQLFQISRALNISPQRQIKVIDVSRRNSAKDLIQHFKPESLIIVEQSGWKRILNKILVSWMLRASSNNTLGKLLQRLFFAPSIICKIVNGRKSKLARINNLGFQNESNSKANVLIGYFQSYLYVDKKILESAMDLKISARAAARIENYRQLSLIENPLLVHVRLGDYTGESTFGLPGLGYYLKALNEVQKHHEITSIWLFSDDPQRAFEIFPIEVQKRMRVVSETGLTSMENLQIMRLCNKYIIANSTYGWWSAELSWADNAEVFFPRPWFRSIEEPIALTPESWNPVPSTF